MLLRKLYALIAKKLKHEIEKCVEAGNWMGGQ
jgi:hypothetical protein